MFLEKKASRWAKEWDIPDLIYKHSALHSYVKICIKIRLLLPGRKINRWTNGDPWTLAIKPRHTQTTSPLVPTEKSRGQLVDRETWIFLRLRAFPYMLSPEGGIKDDRICVRWDRRGQELTTTHIQADRLHNTNRANKISHILANTEAETQVYSSDFRKTQKCSEGFFIYVFTVTGYHWEAAKAGNSTNLIHRSENKLWHIREFTGNTPLTKLCYKVYVPVEIFHLSHHKDTIHDNLCACVWACWNTTRVRDDITW